VEKRDLELGKLRAEIQKLQADITKEEWDSYTAWLGPALTFIALLVPLIVLAFTLTSQRKQALDVQEKQGAQALKLQEKQAAHALALQEKQWAQALALQEKQGQAALDIKVIDLVMSSRSPALALDRAELLSHLYENEVGSAFLLAVKAMTKRHEFPGDLGFELRTKVFTELASKCTEPGDVEVIARNIFSKDEWLKRELVPPKPAPTPGTQNP
jgi:hypothetical protein